MEVKIYRLCVKNDNLMITLSYSQLLTTLRQLLTSKNITQIFDKFSRNARNGDYNKMPCKGDFKTHC